MEGRDTAPRQDDLAARASDDITLLMCDGALFRGMETAAALRSAVPAGLTEIAADARTHRAIAGDPTTEGIRLQMPLPFVLATRTVARSEGWRAEKVMAPGGWCERPGLKLYVRDDEAHGRAAVVQIFVAGDPSMRKSSLKEYTSKTFLAGAGVPEVLRSGDAVSTDATVKGIRTSIANYQRAGIVSDEVATTYAVRARTVKDKDKDGAAFAWGESWPCLPPSRRVFPIFPDHPRGHRPFLGSPI